MLRSGPEKATSSSSSNTSISMSSSSDSNKDRYLTTDTDADDIDNIIDLVIKKFLVRYYPSPPSPPPSLEDVAGPVQGAQEPKKRSPSIDNRAVTTPGSYPYPVLFTDSHCHIQRHIRILRTAVEAAAERGGGGGGGGGALVSDGLATEDSIIRSNWDKDKHEAASCLNYSDFTPCSSLLCKCKENGRKQCCCLLFWAVDEVVCRAERFGVTCAVVCATCPPPPPPLPFSFAAAAATGGDGGDITASKQQQQQQQGQQQQGQGQQQQQGQQQVQGQQPAAALCGDWSALQMLQDRYPSLIVANYGLHPWWISTYRDACYHSSSNNNNNNSNSSSSSSASRICKTSIISSSDADDCPISDGDGDNDDDAVVYSEASITTFMCASLAEQLEAQLSLFPACGVGECGLDPAAAGTTAATTATAAGRTGGGAATAIVSTRGNSLKKTHCKSSTEELGEFAECCKPAPPSPPPPAAAAAATMNGEEGASNSNNSSINNNNKNNNVSMDRQEAILHVHFQAAVKHQRPITLHGVAGVWGKLFDIVVQYTNNTTSTSSSSSNNNSSSSSSSSTGSGNSGGNIVPAVVLHCCNSMGPEMVKRFATQCGRTCKYTNANTNSKSKSKSSRCDSGVSSCKSLEQQSADSCIEAAQAKAHTPCSNSNSNSNSGGGGGGVVYFSFCGRIRPFFSKKEIATLLSIPKERLLIETDSPDQLAKPLRNAPWNLQQNEPSLLRVYAVEIASVLNMDVGELMSLTRNNANRVFRWKY